MRTRCPKCKSLPHTLGVINGGKWFVRCHNCDYCTPLMDDVMDAEKAWGVGLVLPKSEPQNCPWCKGLSRSTGNEYGQFCECYDCWTRGPTLDTEEESIKAWNQLRRQVE